MYATFTITKFTNPNFCTTYPSAFVTGSFSLNETSKSGVRGFTKGQTNTTLILGFSNASFQFNPGVGTVTATGTEVTIVSFSITAATITVTITTSATNAQLNTINFNNIQIKAAAAATGFIKRTGGTFKVDDKTTKPSSTTSWGDLTAGTPLAYSSSTATQSVTSSVFTGATNNQIIGVQVVVTGTCSSLTATAFNFNTTGSTVPLTDLVNAKLYYTGTANVFSTGTLFGSINNPNGAFAIIGSQILNLGAGTYFFWLTYDISSTALPGDVVDAQFFSSVISGTTFTTASGNPVGNRSISNNVFYSIGTGTWSSLFIWSRTPGGASCSCAPISGTGAVYVNHAVSLDNNFTINNVTVQNGGDLTNAASKILTVTDDLATTGTGVFSSSSSWVLNNVATAGTGTSSSSAALTLTGSLSVGTGSTFQMTGGVGLTVNGNLTVDGTLALGTSNVTNSNAAGTIVNGTGSITGSGIITLGVNKNIPAGSNLTISPVINISNNTTITNNGTVNMQNNITGFNTSSNWANATNSVLNMGGTTSELLSTGTLDASAVPNTVDYNGSADQSIKTPSANYYNLYLASSGSGIKSLSGAITVNNDIQISSGAQLNAGANTITLDGNWINNSTNATPFNSTGTVSFNGDDDIISGTGVTSFNNVDITSTGFLTSNSVTGKVIVLGNWVNAGNFYHNNADIIFNGTTTISGASFTDFNTVIVNSTKTLTLDVTETSFAGNLTSNGTLNHNNGLVSFEGVGNTQNINGDVSALTLNQVEVDNPSGKVLLSRPLTINSLLTLTSGNLDIGTNNLTMGSAAAAVGGGPFSATTMIIASGGGQVIKDGTSAATASYTFPVGDNTVTAEYSPVTLTFSTGTYTSGSTGVKITNAKHTTNTNTTNFLNRYWTVTTTGYTVTGATVAATYADADIVGTEANILMGRWTGTKPWVRYASSINTATNTLTSPSISSFGDFTGINNANPTVSISASPAANVCQNTPVPLTANATGDPTITFLWSTGATTSAINPPTSTAGTINYAVTVTDGNGFTANANQDVAVTAAPTAVAGTDVSTCSNSGAVNITTGSSATNTSGVIWTTSNGTGTFTNANSLTLATYTPSAADKTAGSVTLTLTATGNSLCGDATTTKTFITNNTPPTATYTKAPVSTCGGGVDGSITVTASGGTSPYQFNVDGGAFSSNNVLTGLSAGEHIVAVEDAVACTLTMPSITVLTAAPLGVGILNKTNASSCGGGSDGSITVARIGGVFDGVTAIQYSITAGPVTRPLQTSNVFSNLSAGSYTVMVTDSKGCTASKSSITLTQAAAVTVALAYKRNASSCGNGSDGSITVTATGGVLPYDYKLNGVTQLTTSLSSHTYSGLAAGSYMVTVTDSKGCTSSPLAVSIGQATSPVASVPYKGATCTGGNTGFITVGVTGGVAPYLYSKDNGTTFQTSYRFLNLAAGTYNVIVKDFRGCMSNTVSVTINNGTTPCPGIVASNENSSVSSKWNMGNGLLKVQAMPNPTRTEFNLNLQSSSKERVQIIVTDMFGKQLYQTTGSADQRYTFGRQFVSGMYIVQVIQGKSIQTIKLIKGN